MSTNVAVPLPDTGISFCYNDLVPEIATQARDAARRIRAHLKRAAVDIGRELVSIKAIMPHGTFADWVRLEFRMEPRTAQNYMSVATAFGEKCETVSYLPPTTLFALSRRSTPPLARERLLAQIAAGSRPGESEVLEIIRASKAPRSSSAQPQSTTEEHQTSTPSSAIRDKQFDDLAAKILPFVSSQGVHDLIAMLETEGGGKRLADSLIWELSKASAALAEARTAEIVVLGPRRHLLDLPSPTNVEEPVRAESNHDETQEFIDACRHLTRS